MMPSGDTKPFSIIIFNGKTLPFTNMNPSNGHRYLNPILTIYLGKSHGLVLIETLKNILEKVQF